MREEGSPGRVGVRAERGLLRGRGLAGVVGANRLELPPEVFESQSVPGLSWG